MGEAILPVTPRNLGSKWNILFDKKPSDWISFKPELDKTVYSCYSCRSLFSSKSSFRDHINRRIITIIYNCTHCATSLTFYNRCSFMLHARTHFTLHGGEINLNDVEFITLPIGLLGFSTNPNLYIEDEDFVENDVYINTQFYSPDDTKMGKETVTFKPHQAVFERTTDSTGDGQKDLLVLKQICKNIPFCKFVLPEVVMELLKKTLFIEESNSNNNSNQTNVSNNHIRSPAESESDKDNFTMPVISKIESLSNTQTFTRCPECYVIQKTSMTVHFLGTNKPLDESLNCSVCKYIAPTKCSLEAHIRVHDNLAPFVCPECGKTFKSSMILRNHMEDVCFHLTKQIRFRCPGKKCGKLFASRHTYDAHFLVHFQCLHQCSVCDSVFFKYSDFVEHAKQHDICKPKKAYHCTVCQNLPHVLTQDNYKQHINWHTKDRSRCLYVHICRHCRSYFRSNATFAAHSVKCSKSDKLKVLIEYNCNFCNEKLSCTEKDIYKKCLNCNSTNYFPSKTKTTPVVVNDVVSLKNPKLCVLCEEEIIENEETHSRICKYKNPIVSIENISFRENRIKSESTVEETVKNQQTSVDDSPKDNNTEKIEDNTKKKKKRPGGSLVGSKSKKALLNSSTESTTDLQADEPVAFDGTYYCKLCDYQSVERSQFHEHIVTHRDTSTVFQCMECGECFVVKPTLIKHLLHYHKITDTDTYLDKNDCFDKNAIEELENQLKLAPGENKGPVKENQCTVCLKQFHDPLSLNIHFRIHGMAFLMKKVK